MHCDRTLALIAAGASKGVVEALAPRFHDETGATIAGTFGAVGAMKEMLLAGARCDALILTRTLLEALARDCFVVAESIVPLGRVYTGVARRARDADIAIGTGDELRAALLASSSVRFPDPEKATAGIHFMSVLDRLGVRDALAGRLRSSADGATAMAGLAQAEDARPIGCTQVTEILYTPGVRLIGKLPHEFELATVYSAAVCARAEDAALAHRFVELIGGPASEAARRVGGFE